MINRDGINAWPGGHFLCFLTSGVAHETLTEFRPVTDKRGQLVNFMLKVRRASLTGFDRSSKKRGPEQKQTPQIKQQSLNLRKIVVTSEDTNMDTVTEWLR